MVFFWFFSVFDKHLINTLRSRTFLTRSDANGNTEEAPPSTSDVFACDEVSIPASSGEPSRAAQYTYDRSVISVNLCRKFGLHTVLLQLDSASPYTGSTIVDIIIH